MPWEYIGTPWNEVMMLVGALLWACFRWRLCWLGFVLRLGAEKEEMEARWISDWSSPSAEVQSRAGGPPIMFPLGAVCWTGCATGWEGEEDGDDDTL